LHLHTHTHTHTKKKKKKKKKQQKFSPPGIFIIFIYNTRSNASLNLTRDQDSPLSPHGGGSSRSPTLTSAEAAEVEPLWLEGTTQGSILLGSIWARVWRAAVGQEVRRVALEAMVRLAGDDAASDIERDLAGAAAVFLAQSWPFEPLVARDLARLVETEISVVRDKALRVVITAALLKLDSPEKRPADESSIFAD
jgi:hypothetical protein